MHQPNATPQWRERQKSAQPAPKQIYKVALAVALGFFAVLKGDQKDDTKPPKTVVTNRDVPMHMRKNLSAFSAGKSLIDEPLYIEDDEEWGRLIPVEIKHDDDPVLQVGESVFAPDEAMPGIGNIAEQLKSVTLTEDGEVCLDGGDLGRIYTSIPEARHALKLLAKCKGDEITICIRGRCEAKGKTLMSIVHAANTFIGSSQHTTGTMEIRFRRITN